MKKLVYLFNYAIFISIYKIKNIYEIRVRDIIDIYKDFHQQFECRFICYFSFKLIHRLSL